MGVITAKLQVCPVSQPHRAGKLLCTADALSRLPADKAVEYTPIPGDWNLVANFLENSPTN